MSDEIIIQLSNVTFRPTTEQDISWKELHKLARDYREMFLRATERLKKATIYLTGAHPVCHDGGVR